MLIVVYAVRNRNNKIYFPNAYYCLNTIYVKFQICLRNFRYYIYPNMKFCILVSIFNFLFYFIYMNVYAPISHCFFLFYFFVVVQLQLSLFSPIALHCCAYHLLPHSILPTPLSLSMCPLYT